MIWRRVAAQLEGGRQLALGDHREIVARQGRQGEPCPAGIDLHPPLGGDQFDLAPFRQLADDIEQSVGRDGGRAGIGDVGLDPLVDLEVEIGRHQPEAGAAAAGIALLGLDQHVREDRNRVPPLDHRVNVTQALQKRGPLDRRLHRLPLIALILSVRRKTIAALAPAASGL